LQDCTSCPFETLRGATAASLAGKRTVIINEEEISMSHLAIE
jgi:hypothetical protein